MSDRGGLSGPRAAAAAVFALRIAYGAGLVAIPSRLARSWLGTAAERGPTRVPLEGLGTREIVLHGGALHAAMRGGALRPWLAGSIAGDLTDVISTVRHRGELPSGAARATTLVAGGSAALSAVIATLLER